MTISSALEEAAWVYQRIADYDRQQRFDAVVSLSEWGVFSLRHVGQIVGLSHTQVRRIAGGKHDRTGGTFDPACLAPLLEIQKRYRRDEPIEPGAVHAALSAGHGTSAYFAARLTDMTEGWFRARSKSKERSNDGEHERGEGARA
jgi:hypothetical protein